MPLVILFFLFALAFLELYGMFRFAAAFGLGSLVMVIVLTGVLGLLVIRWARFRLDRWGTGAAPEDRAEAARSAVQTVTSSGALWVAGMLLLLPGLIADVCGLLLVIPWTRRIVLHTLKRHVLSGATIQVGGFQQAYRRSPSGQRSDGDDDARDPGTIDAVHWSRGERCDEDSSVDERGWREPPPRRNLPR